MKSVLCVNAIKTLALAANHRMTPSSRSTLSVPSYNNPQFQQQFSPSQSPQYGSIHLTQHYSTTYPSTPHAITYPSTSDPNAYSSTVHQDACLQPQSITQIEYIISTVNQQTHLAEFPQIDSGLAVPVFKQGDDPIDAINKMMSFLSTIIMSRFPTTNNQLRNSSNPRQQATIHDGRCLKPKRKRDATWFKDKVLLVEAQGSGKVLYDEELEFLADPGVAKAKVVLMANLSSTDWMFSPEYLIETQNAAVQDTNSSAQQDAIILSMFEQLSQQVTNCNKVNKDNLMANETLSTELKRYKERVKLLEERQNTDLALGIQIPFYLKKARHIRPMLYDGNVIAKETNVISIDDSKETLMLEEETELQAKDTTIKKLKAHIKRANETSTSESVKKDIDEIETIKIELEHRVTKLIAENKPLSMFKINLETLAPELLNNREAHSEYLKYTQEQVACRKSCNIPKVTNRPVFSSTGVNPSTSASGSKPSGNTKNVRIT
ncbi:hypothetical protein Tco_1026816 [Tanacetum coccineum]